MSLGKFNNRRPMVPLHVILAEQLAETTARKEDEWDILEEHESDRYAWEDDDWYGAPDNDNDRYYDDDPYADLDDPVWLDPFWGEDYMYA